jgi:predicted nucleic acid-binding Zn ribbon protein
MSRYAGDDPMSLADALAAVGAELGLPAGNPMRDLDEHWHEVVGAEVAAHAHLDSVREGTATITVDGPIWATQLRYLERTIIERATALVGPEIVVAVKVRVAGGEAATGRRGDAR